MSSYGTAVSPRQEQQHHHHQQHHQPSPFRTHFAFLPLQDDEIPQLLDPRRKAGLLPSLLRRSASSASIYDDEEMGGIRRASAAHAAQALQNPHVHRLQGNSNPRYQWKQYIKTEEELKKMKKPIREYYERNNRLVEQYMWADALLNSSIVPKLLDSYSGTGTIPEEGSIEEQQQQQQPFRRPPGYVQGMGADEETPLLESARWGADGSGEDHEKIVQFAIHVNFAANAILLAAKIALVILTSSLAVLAALLDSALDFLSTVIVFTTTYLISRKDHHRYPIGRRKLEPVGVLVFSVIMISSFCQVAIEGIQRLAGSDRSIVDLTPSAIAIMGATILLKGACWVWCRTIKSSSVQALAQDAITDVYFNTFAIVFPLTASLTNKYWHWGLWWLDPLGGLLLSVAVIYQWSSTSSEHIKNLTGAASTPDERNLILYVCMRFASTIKKVISLQAYHAGDLLNVEVEVLLEEDIPLKDSHAVGEALQVIIESIPIVDRAFVHLDYSLDNPYGHLDR